MSAKSFDAKICIYLLIQEYHMFTGILCYFPGLKSVNDVKTGVKHVIADIIAKDIPTREDLRKRFVLAILVSCIC